MAQQYMKSNIRITGAELEAFRKKNPTAFFWINTGWGDRQLKRDSRKGWYIHHPYWAPIYYSKSELESIPEIIVYIPPK